MYSLYEFTLLSEKTNLSTENKKKNNIKNYLHFGINIF